MIVDIGKYEYSIIWDGVYQHALSDYPNISKWELKQLILFVEYEEANGRITKFECENQSIIDTINYALNNKVNYLSEQPPLKITECTACRQNGCLTKFLCHTASIENAISIFKCESLLSAVKARSLSAKELCLEQRNAANDPADYFEYIMFSWGNCQAGDRLVMERKLGRFPNEEDLSTGFRPGIRYYFRYNELIPHPNAISDGYHPLKIKNQLELAGNLHAVIIPAEYKEIFEPVIHKNIMGRVFYLEYDCKDIWAWSEKVYNFIEKL